MEYRVLGPLEVRAGGELLSLGGAKQRALFALLLLNANRVVSRERLIDGLWGEDPPQRAVAAVQVYMSRLRKLLPEGRLETRAPGYLFRVEPGELDLERFERLHGEAAAASADGRWRAASRSLAAALELWRGPPLADVADELDLSGELARLEELRLVALEERIAADLALGREAQLVAELDALTQAHPLRERLRGQLMVALYRLGRQADALAVYRDTRRLLVEDLGIEPSAELRQLEQRILVHDQTLGAAVSIEHLPPLPAALTPLVGRAAELAQLGELMRRTGTRLVTLVGAGGVGKTRLALAVAEPVPDAVFVPLAPVKDAELVRSAVARSVGLTDEATLTEWLRPRELLLVLDNFEHVLDAAPLVTELLTSAPGLQVLATSRAPLNLSGEHQYTVAPLPEHDAVELFVERAAAADVSVDRGAVVEDICRRLDCLPLAIELAAARTKTLSPELLLGRLEQRLPFLTGGPRDVPQRQRTLRATIQWSHTLLEPNEQQVFARLAVFVGGCTLDAAEQVVHAEIDTLQSLVSKSLLRHEQGRFWMLETIREYAAEQFTLDESRAQVTRQHAEYFSKLGEAAGTHILVEDDSWIEVLDNDRQNLVAAAAWLKTHEPNGLVRLAAGTLGLWMTRGPIAEGLSVLEPSAGVDTTDSRGHVDVLYGLGALNMLAGNPERARDHFERGLELARALGDRLRTARCLHGTGTTNISADGYVEAQRSLEASVEIYRELGDEVRVLRVLHDLANVALAAGDYERVVAIETDLLAVARSRSDTTLIGLSLANLGHAALRLQDKDAATLFREALSNSHQIHWTQNCAYCLDGLAAVALSSGRLEESARLFGAAGAARSEAGIALDAVERALQVDADTARSLLGDARYTQLTAQGQDMPLEAAIEWALSIPL